MLSHHCCGIYTKVETCKSNAATAKGISCQESSEFSHSERDLFLPRPEPAGAGSESGPGGVLAGAGSGSGPGGVLSAAGSGSGVVAGAALGGGTGGAFGGGGLGGGSGSEYTEAAAGMGVHAKGEIGSLASLQIVGLSCASQTALRWPHKVSNCPWVRPL